MIYVLTDIQYSWVLRTVEQRNGDRRPRRHVTWLTSAHLTLCTDCTKCPCWQPLEFSVIDETTLQLNTTFISGKPASLRYAMHDYPTMVVFDSDGRPAPPFNVTIPYAVS